MASTAVIPDGAGDAGVTLDPSWYWPRQAIAPPDMLIVWEEEFGRLPQPIDEIIGRCRQYVAAAADNLEVINSIADVARVAQQRGQKLAIGSSAVTSTVATGL